MFAPAGFEQFFLDVIGEVATGEGELGQVIGRLRTRYGDEDHPGS